MEMNVLLFAGTTEGRILAERLAELPAVAATVCVATDYGREVLGALPSRFQLLSGRMDAGAMEDLMRRDDFTLVVDATHPYAARASDNIRSAAARATVAYVRLRRAESETADCVQVPTAAAAAERVAKMEGNVLLATGVKELAEFAGVPNHGERMFPRVLPTIESIRRCEELGFRRGHIIAMQGPFGKELNLAVMRQFDIRVMVTKDGGAVGGFPEKLEAAREAGVSVVLIGRPAEADPDAVSLDTLVRYFTRKAKEEA